MKALSLTLTLATTLLTSCVIVVNNGSDDDRTTRRTTKSEKPQAYHTIQEQVPIAKLHSITADLNMEVEYVQKDTTPTAYITGTLPTDYTIKHRGANSGDFHVSLKGHNQRTSSDNVKVKVRIIAPTLHKVMLSTNATFYASTISTTDFTAETRTNATLSIGHLRCEKEAQLVATTNATLHIKALQAQRIDLSARTNATAKLYHIEAQRLHATAHTNADITLMGRVATADLSESTNGDIHHSQLYIAQ